MAIVQSLCHQKFCEEIEQRLSIQIDLSCISIEIAALG